jgi:hypothetical protein
MKDLNNKTNRFLVDYPLIEDLVTNHIKIRDSIKNEDNYDTFKDVINKSDGYIHPNINSSSFFLLVQKMLNQESLTNDENKLKDQMVGSGFKKFFFSLLENKWSPKSNLSDLLRDRVKDWSAYFHYKEPDMMGKTLAVSLQNYQADKEKILKKFSSFSKEAQFSYKDGPVKVDDFFGPFNIESDFFIIYDPYILGYSKRVGHYPLGVNQDKEKISNDNFVIIARRLLFFVDWIEGIKERSKIEGYNPKIIFASGAGSTKIDQWKMAKEVFIKKIDLSLELEINEEKLKQLKNALQNIYILEKGKRLNNAPFKNISHEYTCMTDYGFTTVGSRTLNFVSSRRENMEGLSREEVKRKHIERLFHPYRFSGDLVNRVNIFSSKFPELKNNFNERFQSIKELILASEKI